MMNLALTLIIFFMVYFNRTFEHHMITAIAMAAYTFTALATAIINVIKYRKYNSPVMLTAKIIALSAALVSMLSLETAMLSEFGAEMAETEKRILIAATGGGVSVAVVLMSSFMIVRSAKEMKMIRTKEQKE